MVSSPGHLAPAAYRLTALEVCGELATVQAGISARIAGTALKILQKKRERSSFYDYNCRHWHRLYWPLSY
jgi:hypothetical protein